MMKLRVYLDTSVLSALHDARTPERRRQTEEFWTRRPNFDVSTSQVTREEIDGTPDAAHRAILLSSLAELPVFPLTDEMRALAERYVLSGIFIQTQEVDALHVAAAVLTRHDVILSWNFKHLVNRRRRAMINALNVGLGKANLDIISPPEL